MAMPQRSNPTERVLLFQSKSVRTFSSTYGEVKTKTNVKTVHMKTTHGWSGGELLMW